MVQIVTAAVLIIGNEVLSGRTQDTNLRMLATALGDKGIRVMEARVVADDEQAVVEAVNTLRRRYDLLFTTGGIGPTHDDITAACIAKAFGVPLVLDPRAVERLRRRYSADDLNEARLRMATLPEGCGLIDNPISQAPGFRMDNVYVLAGVPRIAEAMFGTIRDSLTGGTKMLSRTVTMYLPEGQIAAGLAQIQARHPSVEIGSYPFRQDDRLGAAIVIRGSERAAVGDAADAVASLARSLGAEPEDEVAKGQE
jgi:molybdenum cofactor synthesis domain-containing protein